jgi:hypothetical protein
MPYENAIFLLIPRSAREKKCLFKFSLLTSIAEGILFLNTSGRFLCPNEVILNCGFVMEILHTIPLKIHCLSI